MLLEGKMDEKDTKCGSNVKRQIHDLLLETYEWPFTCTDGVEILIHLRITEEYNSYPIEDRNFAL